MTIKEVTMEEMLKCNISKSPDFTKPPYRKWNHKVINMFLNSKDIIYNLHNETIH